MLVELKPFAKDDVSAAFDFYRKRSRLAGAKFFVRLDQALNRIELFPKSARGVTGGFRVTRVRDYPYLIDFRVSRKRVWVYAVLHTSLDPGAHKSRLISEEE